MTDRNGEGISLLILSVLQPLVPLNVTWASLSLKATGLHLSKRSTTSPSGTSRPKTMANSVGSCPEEFLLAGSGAQHSYNKAKTAENMNFIRELHTYHIATIKIWYVSGLQFVRE